MRGKKAKLLRKAILKATAGNKDVNFKRVYRKIKQDYMNSSRILKVT